MATYSIAQYQKRLKSIQAELNNQKLYVGAASEVGRMVAKRIFQDGISSDGGEIMPPYSGTPITITKEKTPIKSAARRYQGGYGEFKRAIGRGGRVNLFLFGFFNRAYLASILNPVVKVSAQGVTVGIGLSYSTQNPKGKVDGLLDKYEDAFKFSQEERETYLEENRKILRKLWQ